MNAEWVGIMLASAPGLISIGISLARLAAARAAIRRLERSAEQQGQRLGNLEGDVRVLYDRQGSRRKPTAAQGVVAVAVEDGGSDD